MCAAGGAGGSTTIEALQKADAMWYKLRHAKVSRPCYMSGPDHSVLNTTIGQPLGRRMQTGTEAGAAPVFVKEYQEPLPSEPRFDVVRSLVSVAPPLPQSVQLLCACGYLN
jgi:hypothetical protein